MSNPTAKGDWKKDIIDSINKNELKDGSFKFIGLFPIDNEVDNFKPNPETAMKIFKAKDLSNINLDI